MTSLANRLSGRSFNNDHFHIHFVVLEVRFSPHWCFIHWSITRYQCRRPLRTCSQQTINTSPWCVDNLYKVPKTHSIFLDGEYEDVLGKLSISDLGSPLRTQQKKVCSRHNPRRIIFTLWPVCVLSSDRWDHLPSFYRHWHDIISCRIRGEHPEAHFVVAGVKSWHGMCGIQGKAVVFLG